ncbi:MAG: FHA domain-containing protein [Planctomycetes bacterium]|nr:FHA domain-containing protein [Planctomycetota bacterium]
MNANLVLLKNNGTTKTFPLPGSVTVVGRQQECDLCIPLMVVSRKHCEINHDGGVLRVRDLGSRNGTLVNGKKIADAVLNAGDTLHIGPVSFAIQFDGVPAEPIGPESASSVPATGSPEPEYHPGDGIGDLDETNDLGAVEDVGTVEDDDILEIMEAVAENGDEDEAPS